MHLEQSSSLTMHTQARVKLGIGGAHLLWRRDSGVKGDQRESGVPSLVSSKVQCSSETS